MKRVMRMFFVLLFILATFSLQPVFAGDIASCGESSGYVYFSHRGWAEEKDVRWDKDARIPNGKISLKQDDAGNFDLLVVDATGDIFSSVSQGATVVPAIISDEAITVIVIYPKLVEAYVFQKLKSGKYQVMWTQAKAETPLPLISAFIADCSYLNLAAFKKE